MPRTWSRRPFLTYIAAVVGPTLVVMAFGFVAVRRQHGSLETLRTTNQRLQEARIAGELDRALLDAATTALNELVSTNLAQRLANSDLVEVDRARAEADGLRIRHPVIGEIFVVGVEGVRYPRVEAPLLRTIEDVLDGESEPVRTRLRRLLERAESLESVDWRSAASLYDAAAGQATTTTVKAFTAAALARARGIGGDTAGATAAWTRVATQFSDAYNPLGRPYAVVAAAELATMGAERAVVDRVRGAVLQGHWTLTPDQAGYFLDRLTPNHELPTGRYMQTLGFGRRLRAALPGGLTTAHAGTSTAALATTEGFDQLFFVARPELQQLAGISLNLDWVRAALLPTVASQFVPEATVRLNVEPPNQLGFSPGTTVWHVSLVDSEGSKSRTSVDLLVFAAATVMVIGVLVMGVILLARDVTRETRLNQMRADLASGVSHELKTPLSVIRIYAETIDETPEITPVERRHFTDAIVHETERLRRLVDDVVDFSRIQQGQRAYRLKEGSLAIQVAKAVEAFRPYAELHGYTVRAEIGEATRTAVFDPVAVEQAVLNLLDNAAKYSGDSTEINVRLVASDGGLVIEVEDGGIGIPEGEQHRIFDRFHRGAHSNRGGYGLGLYIVRHIMEAHGGRVDVTSVEGKGSCFRLVFPEPSVTTRDYEHAKGVAR